MKEETCALVLAHDGALPGGVHCDAPPADVLLEVLLEDVVVHVKVLRVPIQDIAARRVCHAVEGGHGARGLRAGREESKARGQYQRRQREKQWSGGEGGREEGEEGGAGCLARGTA